MSDKISESSSDFNTHSNSSSNSNSYNDNNINLDLHNNIIGDYNVIAQLGQGSYSKVWLTYNINDMKYYALKVINANDYEDGKEELKTMKIIPKNEQHINGLKEYFIESQFVNNSDNEPTNFLCIVYYLCAGNLDGLGRKGQYNKGYPSAMVKTIVQQTLNALNCVHNKLKGFHGDIKPDNILLCGYNNRDKQYINMYDKLKFNNVYNTTKKQYCLEKNITKLSTEQRQKIRLKVHRAIIESMDPNKEEQYKCDPCYFNNMTIKLTDFGFFCKKTEQFNKPFGTRYYMAPEIILMGECSDKVDIWALGCMIYELLTGEILFDPHSSSHGSTDHHHLEMMILLCGEFDKYFLRQTKNYKNFFKNDKLMNIIYTDDYRIPLNEKLTNKMKQHNINNLNLVKLIASMLQLNPKFRPNVQTLLTAINSFQW